MKNKNKKNAKQLLTQRELNDAVRNYPAMSAKTKRKYTAIKKIRSEKEFHRENLQNNPEFHKHLFLK